MSELSSSVRDPKTEALEYLEKHRLLQLFELLGAKIAFVKPEDPNAFLSSELLKVSAMMTRGQPVNNYIITLVLLSITLLDFRSHFLAKKIFPPCLQYLT